MSKPVKISGSRAAAILGMSSYQTLINVWLQIQEELEPGFCEKNKYEKPEFESNSAIEFGKAFETPLINIVEKIKNVKLEHREKLFIKDDYLSCHVDAIINNEILVENKSTSLFYFNDNWGEAESERIPLGYMMQIQHNLYCTGLKKCLQPVLIFPKRTDDYVNDGIELDKIDKDKWVEVLYEMGHIKFFNIEANEKLQNIMRGKYNDFWHLNIINKIMPEPANYDDIKRIYTEPKGTIIATDELETLVREYQEIQVEIGKGGKLAKRQEQLKTYILNEMRKMDNVIDDESREKTVLRDKSGHKLLQYGAKGGFRVS